MREEQIREAGNRLMEAGQKLADLTGYRAPKDVKDLNRELVDEALSATFLLHPPSLGRALAKEFAATVPRMRMLATEG
jgi:hypothetical protein